MQIGIQLKWLSAWFMVFFGNILFGGWIILKLEGHPITLLLVGCIAVFHFAFTLYVGKACWDEAGAAYDEDNPPEDSSDDAGFLENLSEDEKEHFQTFGLK